MRYSTSVSGCSALMARYCAIIGVCAVTDLSLAFMKRYASVQFHPRLGLAPDDARQRVQRHTPEAVQRPQMQLVQRHVKQLRHQPFDAYAAARGKPHQRAD